MNSRFSRIFSLILLAVMFAVMAVPVATPANAQGYCALSQDECDLFDAAMQAQENITSLTIDSMNVAMTVDANGQSLDIGVVNMAGPIAYYRNQLDFDAAWTVETVTVQVPDSTGSISLTGMEIRVVDGELYFYNPVDGTWETDALDLGELEGLMSNSSMNMSDNEFSLSPSNEVWSADMVTWTTESTDINGTDMVKFTADVKLGDMLSNQGFMLNVGELLEVASEGEMTAQLFQFLMGGVALQIKDELNDGTFQISYYVSPEDNLVYGFDMLVDATLDLGFLSGIVDDMDVEVITLNMEINATMSGYNETYEITAPELD